MPKHTDDTWRFTNTKNLNLDKYHQISDIKSIKKESFEEQSNQLNLISGKIVFVDDHQCRDTEFDTELKEKGVSWTTLEDAFLITVIL